MLKPLETKEAREKRIRRQNTIFGIVIAIIMIAGTIGWAITSRETEKQQSYNGFKFKNNENFWQTTIKVYGQNFLLQTSFLPQEVESVASNLETLSLEKFLGKVVFFVAFSASELQAAQELAINLQYFVVRMQMACPSEHANESFCLEKPIKSCDDADLDTVIILLEESNETRIDFEKGCLRISGKETEIIKAADKTLFVAFGIMKG